MALRCAADYLEMTQKDTTGASQDLVSATEAYIHDTAFESLDSATALLKTCHVSCIILGDIFQLAGCLQCTCSFASLSRG